MSQTGDAKIQLRLSLIGARKHIKMLKSTEIKPMDLFGSNSHLVQS